MAPLSAYGQLQRLLHDSGHVLAVGYPGQDPSLQDNACYVMFRTQNC